MNSNRPESGVRTPEYFSQTPDSRLLTADMSPKSNDLICEKMP
jgi:hypothetical protein